MDADSARDADDIDGEGDLTAPGGGEFLGDEAGHDAADGAVEGAVDEEAHGGGNCQGDNQEPDEQLSHLRWIGGGTGWKSCRSGGYRLVVASRVEFEKLEDWALGMGGAHLSGWSRPKAGPFDPKTGVVFANGSPRLPVW